MDDEYKGAMPDEWFRKLGPIEERKFRKVARETWSPTKPENFSVFHPIVRDEWRKMDELYAIESNTNVRDTNPHKNAAS